MGEVEVVEIEKKFGQQQVLDKVSMKVEDGEFMVVLGPSGCGKTTLLRIIAGLTKPDAGRVMIDNKDVTDVEPYDRNVAMVFQNYALYPHMTVFDNIAFPLKMRKVGRGEIERRVKEVADTLQISELLTRRPYQLSGGQQQRVALARALVRDPKVFLFDEPLSNLDAKLRVQMREELKKFHFRFKITTIYVTHDQVEAMSLGNRVAVMDRGRIVQVGTPSSIYNSPVNSYVATFIGMPPMNLMKGRICESPEGRLTICVGDVRFPIKVGELDEVKGEITVGFRPSEVSLECHEDCVKGETIFTEPLGDEYIVHVLIGGEEVNLKLTQEPPAKELRFRVRRFFLFNEKGDLIGVTKE